MFRVEWIGPAFDQMNQIIQLNPDRKEELAESLREFSSHTITRHYRW